MKFIYSLMLFTFLMSTFTPVTGWGAASGCLSEYNEIVGSCKEKESRADCKKRADAVYRECAYNEKSPVKQIEPVKVQQPTAAPAPIIKSNTTKASTTPKPKKSTATPAKEETSTQQVNVPATQSIYCNDQNYKSGSCYCKSGETKETPNNTLNATVSKCVASSGGNTIIPPKFDVDECLNGIKYYVDACSDDAKKAVSSCDPDEQAASGSDSSFDMKNILNAANALALKKGAGSGAYDTCLQTALITQAGYYTTDQLKQVCQPQVDQCKSSCETAKNALHENQNDIYLNCKKQAQAADPNLSDDEFVSEYGNNIVKQLSDLIALSESSSQACEKDAADFKAQIEQANKDFNNAAKQAQICRCQTGSTGEDCSAIKGPAECALNPNAVGCAMSTINCNNSDSLQCRCTRNPNLAECNPKNGGPSVFASPGFKPTTTTPNGVSPKISGEDFDINFDEESNVAAVSGTSGLPTSPFGSAEAGGSGGGGGGAAGKAGEGDPAAVATDEGGLKMLLDKAKGFVGNSFGKIFGTGTPSDKKFKTDAYGRKIDPNKWRPGMLRGVAGDGSEIGPKHRDIWKQMNSQYFLQDKTFIQEK